MRNPKSGIKDLDSLIKQLFESKSEGSLSAKRFEILTAEYEIEQEDLERQIAKLQAGLEVYDAESGNTEQFIKLVRKYTEIPELTPTILNEYIEKIVVLKADKSSGRIITATAIKSLRKRRRSWRQSLSKHRRKLPPKKKPAVNANAYTSVSISANGSVKSVNRKNSKRNCNNQNPHETSRRPHVAQGGKKIF